MERLEILEILKENMGEEKLLEEMTRAMSDVQAKEIFSYIARIHEIDLKNN